jgi:hypothetical protein
MGRGVQVAQRQWIETSRYHISQTIVVARGLRHLQAVDQQVLTVHPIIDKGLTRITLALRDLILVMRED